MSPLISVIIPIYNISAYLPKCVDSVLNQTYQHLEIILVDDGSTDDCPGICDDYARKDKRIRVIHKKNGGLSDARNKGIELSEGEYITFIDGDDYVEPDMVEYLHHLLAENRADMSVCQYNKVYEETEKVQPVLHIRGMVAVGNEECVKAFFTFPIGTVAWGKLYRRSMFSKIRYPYGKFHEDVYTTYRLVALCNRIVVGNEHKYNYLQRRNSITKSPFQMKHLDNIKAASMQRRFIRERYPECVTYANAAVVDAVIGCVVKMIRSYRYLPGLLQEMQGIIRRYELDYLRGRYPVKAKLFSLAAFVSLKLLVKSMIALYSFLGGWKKRRICATGG